MNKQERAKMKKKVSGHKAAMGLIREAHFSAGGDLPSWRGRANVFVDRKKKADKGACRKRLRPGQDY